MTRLIDASLARLSMRSLISDGSIAWMVIPNVCKWNEHNFLPEKAIIHCAFISGCAWLANKMSKNDITYE